jgi:hypothetical protein
MNPPPWMTKLGTPAVEERAVPGGLVRVVEEVVRGDRREVLEQRHVDAAEVRVEAGDGAGALVALGLHEQVAALRVVARAQAGPLNSPSRSNPSKVRICRALSFTQ